jgi:hypothetical protein
MNDAIFAILKNFVETTLNRPFADIAALLTTEGNEIKQDASEILKNLDTNRVNEIKAGVNPEHSEIFKDRVKNAKIEAARKFEAEKTALLSEIKGLKEIQTADQLRLTERENALKTQFDNEKAAILKEKDDYMAKIAKKEKDSKIRTIIENGLPISKYKDVPQSAKPILLENAMNRIGDIVEKDGKFSHFVDKNGIRIENAQGYAITPEQIGHDVLQQMYMPLVQPPISGSGNTNSNHRAMFDVMGDD